MAPTCGIALTAPAGYLLHLLFACLTDALTSTEDNWWTDMSALDLHRRALLAGCATPSTDCVKAPTLTPHEHVLVWLQVSMALCCAAWLYVAQKRDVELQRMPERLLLAKFGGTALFALGNLHGGSEAWLLTHVFVAAVVHTVVLLPMLRELLAGVLAAHRTRTLPVFVYAVDFGICAVKGAAAFCTVLQAAVITSPCRQETTFVVSVCAVAAGLVSLSPLPDAAVQSLFGQFAAIPLIATLCSVDSTSSSSPQVVGFCGVASSAVVIAAGANFAGLLTEPADEAPPCAEAVAAPRRALHSKAF
jgi:hypothetical protein